MSTCKWLTHACTSLVLCFCGIATAQVEPETKKVDVPFHEDTWHVTISPYLWMAGMDGTLSIGGHEAQVKQSFTDIFSSLKFGVMGLTDIHRGRIGILTDVMWIRLGDEKSIPVQGLPSGVDLTS